MAPGGAVHFPADVQALDIDFYAFSGHKLYGPTGIGALYGKSELLAAMSPGSAAGIAEVSFDGFTPQPPPMASRPVRRMSPGLSASAPRWSGWRRAISARRKTGAAVWQAWRKRNWRNGRASALSAASSQACWPLNLRVFITAIW